MLARLDRALLILGVVLVNCGMVMGQARQAPAPPPAPPRNPAAPAANPANTPAKPAVLPIVTVTKNDGSTVHGQLVESDHDGVRIRAVVKGKPEGDPVLVKWSQVKNVSNSLTRQRAIMQWKAQHKDELCADCKGDRTMVCETCHGIGHDPAASKDCNTCKGELLVDCTGPRCDEGKLPCPRPCLKLTDAGWIKKADGSRTRTVRGMVLTESNVGELIEIKNNTAVSTPCETCGKTGKINCPICLGKGKMPCPTCKANKSAADCAACEEGAAPCKTCMGTGLRK